MSDMSHFLRRTELPCAEVWSGRELTKIVGLPLVAAAALLNTPALFGLDIAAAFATLANALSDYGGDMSPFALDMKLSFSIKDLAARRGSYTCHVCRLKLPCPNTQ